MCARRIRPTSSAGTACTYDSQRKWEKSVYCILNIDISLTKTHCFATGGLSSRLGDMSRRTLFHIFWTVDKKHPLTPIVTLGARAIFNITLIGFVWKKKVIYSSSVFAASWNSSEILHLAQLHLSIFVCPFIQQQYYLIYSQTHVCLPTGMSTLACLADLIRQDQKH